MKKLEEIPKKKIFEVPDGYFEKLPGIIQSRVARPQERHIPAFSFGFRLALPLLVMAIAAIIWLSRPGSDVNAENILASVQTEDLIAYLTDADFTTDELLDDVQLDAEDVTQIEESVYQFQFNDSEIEDILNETEP